MCFALHTPPLELSVSSATKNDVGQFVGRYRDQLKSLTRLSQHRVPWLSIMKVTWRTDWYTPRWTSGAHSDMTIGCATISIGASR
jgi:hypothetical protein